MTIRKLKPVEANDGSYGGRVLAAWGKRHGITTFAEATWQAGFAQGWKMALARMARKDEDGADRS